MTTAIESIGWNTARMSPQCREALAFIAEGLAEGMVHPGVFRAVAGSWRVHRAHFCGEATEEGQEFTLRLELRATP